ncbi:MAG: hypothetical protein M3Y72_23825 [Acidobacteriota bacterium]|nr:hypothetical protein [Acidobacteriota bacterium]
MSFEFCGNERFSGRPSLEAVGSKPKFFHRGQFTAIRKPIQNYFKLVLPVGIMPRAPQAFSGPSTRINTALMPELVNQRGHLMRFVASCVLVSLAFTTITFAGQSTSTSFPPGFTVVNSGDKPGIWQSKMMPTPLVAPLFIEDERRTSVITIVSDAPSAPLDLDIIALNPSGELIAKQTVTISPRGEKTIAVADILASLPISWPVYGSISLKPHRSSTFAAQLSIAGRTGTATDDVEEEFAMLMDEKPAIYRAVTLLESPFIAVRSLSGKQETVVIDCLRRNEGQAAKTSIIPIPPNQMLLLRACNNAGTVPVSDFAETEAHGQADPEISPVALSIQ